MKRTLLFIALVVAGLVVGQRHSAHATVDVFLPYHYAYADLQSGDLCLARHQFWAQIGIPPASQAEASVAPVMVYRQGPGAFPVDINVLSNTGLVPRYVSDLFTEAGVLDYAMRLDMSDSVAELGAAGAVEVAKLYLLAMAANLDTIAPDGWRLDLAFDGLPPQTGLPGTPLYADTIWPYTTGSGLLAAYRAELLDRHGTCRAEVAP